MSYHSGKHYGPCFIWVKSRLTLNYKLLYIDTRDTSILAA